MTSGKVTEEHNTKKHKRFLHGFDKLTYSILYMYIGNEQT